MIMISLSHPHTTDNSNETDICDNIATEIAGCGNVFKKCLLRSSNRIYPEAPT